MVLRLILGALAALVLIPLGWRLAQSDSLRAWSSPAPAAGKPFQFDNGSVRAPALPASGSTAAVAPGLKKCRVGDRVIYTDAPCPQGGAVVPIGGTVNVVAAPRQPEAAAAAVQGGPASQARRTRTIRDVIDTSSGPSLYDQHIDRVTQQVR